MPRVSAQERLHCSSIRQSRNAMDFHPDEGGLESVFCSCTVKCGSGSLFHNVSRCSWWRYFGVLFLTCVVSSDLPQSNFIKFLKPLVHSLSPICAVRRCGFPSLGVYLQRFEVSLETSCELRCACRASSLRQLALRELLWYSVIVHLDNMTKPVHSPLL